MTDRRVLVDGDIVVYRCGFAAEHTVYTLTSPDGVHIIGIFNKAADYKAYVKEKGMDVADFVVETEKVIEPLSHALANVKSVMSRIADEGNQVIVFLSQGDCFRSKLATLAVYKGNRKDAPRPVHYADIRKYLVDHYDTRIVNELEADDALALCQDGMRTVIASIDKDLLQVPGLHYNWVKDERVLITPEVAQKKLYMQVLTGDATDNIPGIRGIGPAKARALIDKCTTEEEMLTVCYNEWEKYLKEYMAYDPELNCYEYVDVQTGEPRRESAINIVDEIIRLLTVGGHDAKVAAVESREEVLLSSRPKEV